jgi:hypothetical protein
MSNHTKQSWADDEAVVTAIFVPVLLLCIAFTNIYMRADGRSNWSLSFSAWLVTVLVACFALYGGMMRSLHAPKLRISDLIAGTLAGFLFCDGAVSAGEHLAHYFHRDFLGINGPIAAMCGALAYLGGIIFGHLNGLKVWISDSTSRFWLAAISSIVLTSFAVLIAEW